MQAKVWIFLALVIAKGDVVLMKENILMSNIHCPFICFCKPSAAARLYAAATASGPSPLRLDSAPPPQTAPCRVVCVSDKSFDDAKDDGGLKSCIKEKKATDSGAAEGTEKKRVEWVDSVGRELAEIREFESSESGEIDEEEEEENPSMCASVCTIL